MIIKKAKYKKVMTKQLKCINEAVYGCDECGKEIKDFPNEPSRLEVTVFYHEKESNHLHFCSWACVLNHLPRIKTDYFITLPFIMFDVDSPDKKIVPKRSGKELLKLLNNLFK